MRERVPLVTFSSALQGSVPISAYSHFIASVAQHAVVWETGNTPNARRSELDRVQEALNVEFSTVVAIGHSTGANVARRISCADKLVLIDPFETAGKKPDLTAESRARMRVVYDANSTDMDHWLCDGPAKDPCMIILSGDDSSAHAHASLAAVRVREMQHFDIFDDRDRMLLTGERPSSDTPVRVRRWLAETILALCGVT